MSPLFMLYLEIEGLQSSTHAAVTLKQNSWCYFLLQILLSARFLEQVQCVSNTFKPVNVQV